MATTGADASALDNTLVVAAPPTPVVITDAMLMQGPELRPPTSMGFQPQTPMTLPQSHVTSNTDPVLSSTCAPLVSTVTSQRSITLSGNLVIQQENANNDTAPAHSFLTSNLEITEGNSGLNDDFFGFNCQLLDFDFENEDDDEDNCFASRIQEVDNGEQFKWVGTSVFMCVLAIQ